MVRSKMKTVRRNALAALALATLHAPAAWAADPPAVKTASVKAEPAPLPADEQAERLLTEGRALFAQGKSEAALDKLRAAWALRRSYTIAANLGTAELDLGKMRDAAEHFDFALREMPASVEKAKRDALEGYLQKARAAVAALRVEVEPPGARISVDGTPAGEAPLRGELFVEPGKHTVAAQGDGFTPASEPITAAAGEAKTVSLRLARAVAAPPPTAAASAAPTWSADDRAPQMGMWLVVGVGAIVAGVYSVSLGMDSRPRVSDHTTSDLVTGIGVTEILLGLGSGIGGVLYERSVRWPPPVALGVVPLVGAHGGGACLIGTF